MVSIHPTTIKSPKVTAAERIANELRERIDSGAFSPGELFPGRRALGHEFQSGLLTIDAAIKLLVSEGLLRTEDRRGTFVAHRSSNELKFGGGDRTVTSDKSAAILGIITRVNVSTDVDISKTWMSPVIAGIEHEFAGPQRSTRLFNTYLGPDLFVAASDAIERLIREGVDAIVYVTPFAYAFDAEEAIRVSEQLRVPLIFVTHDEIPFHAPHVYYDNTNGGFQAAIHLLAAGWQDIVFVARNSYDWTLERLEGAKQALRRLGRESSTIDVCIIGEADDPEVPTVTSVNALIDTMSNISGKYGVIAAQDCIGQCAMDILQLRWNWTAGIDYAVIGFDDDPQSPFVGLSTIRPPFEAMGREAARLALRCIGGDSANMQARYRPILIPRLSTAQRNESARNDP